MRKTMVVEYVGIDDVHELVDMCSELMNAGHYANLDFSNIGKEPRVEVSLILGGWQPEHEYELDSAFYFGTDDYDVQTMNECKAKLRAFLPKKDVTIDDIEENLEEFR